jgi:hypothetical protein
VTVDRRARPCRDMRPGQRVRCVTARLAPLLAEGQEYVVARYWPPGTSLSPRAVVTLVETRDAMWFAARFAPLGEES